jgi:hypothetical protein
VQSLLNPQTPIEEKQDWLNFVLQFVIPTNKSAAWVADAYIHSQKNYFNYRQLMEFKFLEYENQDSVNSEKNIAIRNIQGGIFEPDAIFDQNFTGSF